MSPPDDDQDDKSGVEPRDEASQPETPDEQAHTGETDDSMRDLLRSALSVERTPLPDMLPGVQRRIRQRSRGKFYRDRWALEKNPPIHTYLVTALLMLVVLFVAYALLRPLSGASNAVHNEAAPVRVVPPPRH